MSTYLTALVLEDAARREPLDLVVRMHYLYNRADDADEIERAPILAAIQSLRNGCQEAGVMQRRLSDAWSR